MGLKQKTTLASVLEKRKYPGSHSFQKKVKLFIETPLPLYFQSDSRRGERQDEPDDIGRDNESRHNESRDDGESSIHSVPPSHCFRLIIKATEQSNIRGDYVN